MKPHQTLITLILPALILGACTQTASAPINRSNTSTSPTAISSPSTATAASYAATDVASHNSTSSCWVIINNNVYNITSYGSQHPGGNQIYQGCGQDITSYMQNSHKPVDYLLPQFLIGSLR